MTSGKCQHPRELAGGRLTQAVGFSSLIFFRHPNHRMPLRVNSALQRARSGWPGLAWMVQWGWHLHQERTP
jgi:hypothetical protein